MGAGIDQDFKRSETRARLLAVTLYAAAIFAGYAAGIGLMMWRLDDFAATQAAIARGDIGVEQITPANASIAEAVRVEYLDRFGGRGRVSNLWAHSTWAELAAAIWVAVLLASAVSIRLPGWLAPRGVRAAIGGAEGAEARAIWRRSLAVAAGALRSPIALAAGFTGGLAAVVVGDLLWVTPRWGPLPWLQGLVWGVRAIQFGFVMQFELAVLGFAAVALPICVIRSRAARSVRRDPAMTRRWCVPCGHLRGDGLAAGASGAPCAECGGFSPVQPETGSWRRQAAAAFTVAVVLAAVFAVHRFTLMVDRVVGELTAGRLNRHVTIGGIYTPATVAMDRVVQVSRPSEDFWFRYDLVADSGNPDRSGADAAPDDGVWVLRIASRAKGDPLPDRPPAGQGGARRIQHLTINPKRDGTDDWQTRSVSFAIHFGEVQAQNLSVTWNRRADLLVIRGLPQDVTSIRTVDPATAPEFED